MATIFWDCEGILSVGFIENTALTVQYNCNKTFARKDAEN